jgi:hypothetical protein
MTQLYYTSKYPSLRGVYLGKTKTLRKTELFFKAGVFGGVFCALYSIRRGYEADLCCLQSLLIKVGGSGGVPNQFAQLNSAGTTYMYI